MRYFTIMTSGYTVQRGTDPRATGGVTHAEIARTIGGFRLRRTDANGRFVSSGRSEPITESEVREMIETAVGRGPNGGLSSKDAACVRDALGLGDPHRVVGYTCSGGVRGDCGIRHRTVETAAQCCHRDHLAVRRGHGGSAYSDRQPEAVRANGTHRGLTDDERERADAARVMA